MNAKSKVEAALHALAVSARMDAEAKALREEAIEALREEGLTPAPGAKYAVANGIVLGTVANVPDLVSVPAVMLATALRDGLAKPDLKVIAAAYPGAVTYTEGTGPLRFRPDRDA